MANYISQNRYGTFYFRFIIPLAYRKHFKNNREIRYSLKTDSKRLAVIRARLYRVRVDNILEQLESMAKDETITTELMTFTTFNGRKKEVDLGDVEKEMQVIATWEKQDDENARQAGMPMPQTTTSQPSSQSSTNPSSRTWESFSSNYLDVILGGRKKRAKETIEGLKATYSLLPFILGKNRSLQSFTNEDMETLYEGLRILPVRFKSPTSPYKDMSFQQLKMADVPTSKLRSIRTINQDFGRINTVFKKACKAGIIPRNIADTVEYEIDQTPDKERREPYDDNDLQKIFTHPHFTANLWRKVAKTRTPDPYTFWLLPLALFTGARMNELLQLEKKHIAHDEGCWYLDIKNEYDPKTGIKIKSVKNNNSIRRIPISDQLINMGFIKFVNASRTNALFPEVDLLKTKKKAAGKKLNYRLKTMLKKTEAEAKAEVQKHKTFHSLRHTFVGNAVNMGAKPQFVGGVTGHLDKEEFKGVPELANTYYKGYPVDILKTEVIDKLDFDVDFSGVQWP